VAQAAVLETTLDKVTSVLAERLSLPPKGPRLVNDAPHKERVLREDEIDLMSIPGFQHGGRDPGPGLIVMNICREPDGGAVNFSLTRLAPFEARRGTMLIASSPHQRAILEKWEARDEPMPMACVVGTHPAYEIMASYSVPDHLEKFGELELVGNLTGGTIEMVPCESVPLEVPAHAELEPTRRAGAEIRARIPEREVGQRELRFGDQNIVVFLELSEAMRDPGIVHGGGARGDFIDPRLIGRCLVSLGVGDFPAPCVDPALRGFFPAGHRFLQLRQGGRRAAPDTEVAGESAHRVVFEQWIGAEVNDLGVRVQFVQ
jgi:hypothetical protein